MALYLFKTKIQKYKNTEKGGSLFLFFLYKLEILCSIELLLHDNKQKLVEWQESPLYSASVLSINIILPYAIANIGFFWR